MNTTRESLASNRRPPRRRPRLFRALGTQDPPPSIELDGRTFDRCEIYKHDSWAATAMYECQDGGRAVCKFQRQQPVFGLPMSWFGCWLARHERAHLHRMKDEPRVPDAIDDVKVAGIVPGNVVAHEYVAGRPLRRSSITEERFFDALDDLVSRMHSRRTVYVDLHKPENIIVGDDGEPYLVDFQISLFIPQSRLLEPLFRMLQQSDRYHLVKHRGRSRFDWSQRDEIAIDQARPWWIRLHRLVAVPFRRMRRVFLIALGVRRGSGFANTEQFVEAGQRPIRRAE